MTCVCGCALHLSLLACLQISDDYTVCREFHYYPPTQHKRYSDCKAPPSSLSGSQSISPLNFSRHPDRQAGRQAEKKRIAFYAKPQNRGDVRIWILNVTQKQSVWLNKVVGALRPSCRSQLAAHICHNINIDQSRPLDVDAMESSIKWT